MRTFIVAFMVSLIASLILTPLFRNWAIRSNWVDEVGGRKIHTQPIPRVGGIAVLVSAMLPLIALGWWDNDISREFLGDMELIRGSLAGIVIIALVGIYDDLKGVPAVVKLLAQIAAASAAYFAGIHIENFSTPFFFWSDLGFFSYPMTVFWFVLAINAINLIDGMDGLAGSVVGLATGTLFLMCLIEDKVVACLLLISILGGVLGFLRYNLHPASIFLGDTGSMALGFILSVISVHFTQKSSAVFSLVASVLVLGIPIFDLGMAVVRRSLAGRKIFSADQYHIHHILLRKGFSQNQSVGLLVGAAIFFEGLALVHIFIGDKLDAVVLVAAMLAMAGGIRVLGYDKIIFHQRRDSVLDSTQKEGEKAVESIAQFQQREYSSDTVMQALENLCIEHQWECSVHSPHHSVITIHPIYSTQAFHMDGLGREEICIGDTTYTLQWRLDKGRLPIIEKLLMRVVVEHIRHIDWKTMSSDRKI